MSNDQLVVLLDQSKPNGTCEDLPCRLFARKLDFESLTLMFAAINQQLDIDRPHITLYWIFYTPF